MRRALILFLVTIGPFASERVAQAQAFTEGHRLVPHSVWDVLGVAFGDADQDGDEDVLYGYGEQGVSGLYLNDGQGRFLQAPLAATSGMSGAPIFLDLDADGDLDAAVGEQLFENLGGAVYIERSTPTGFSVGRVSAGIAVGDLGGDGFPEILVVRPYSASSLYSSDGLGGLTDLSALLPAFTFASAVAFEDLDRDGDLDLFLGRDDLLLFGGQANEVYLNDGSGGLQLSTGWVPALPDPTACVRLGDFDGDFDVDALVGNRAGPARFLRNVGGRFLDARLFPTNPSDYGLCHALDFDLDSDIDFLVGAEIFLNRGAGVFDTSIALPSTLLLHTASAAADVDGDGDPDLLGGQNTGAVELFLNDGSGMLAHVGTDLQRAHYFFAADVGDLNGDGRDDAVTRTTRGNRVWIADGYGDLVEKPGAITTTLPVIYRLALGDLDGDGDRDLLLGTDEVHLNDGSGTFGLLPGAITPSSPTVRDLAFGDLNADGHLDVFAVASGLNTARVLLGDGTGKLTDSPSPLPPLSYVYVDVELGDLDGDGDLDAMLGAADINQIYLNQGDGSFATFPWSLPFLSDPTSSIALGDVDGDGDLDMYVGQYRATLGNPVGSLDHLLLNDGTGHYSDAAGNLPSLAKVTTDVAFADIDADGDLDALVSSVGPGGVLQANDVLQNDGGGNFSAHSSPGPLATSDFIRPFDVDGDGDTDAFLGDRLLLNTSRQLVRRTLARPGRVLELDIFGSPGAYWLVAYSAQAANLPFGRFGTLQLDPNTLLIQKQGVFGGTGRAQVRGAIPNDPSLIDQTFYLQGMAGRPLLLTNAEAATIVGF